MNKRVFLIFFTLFLVTLIISACGSSTNQHQDDKNIEKRNFNTPLGNGSDSTEENNEGAIVKRDSNNDDATFDIEADKGETVDKNTLESVDSNPLAAYSSQEIEYARIWLQLGDTQDIDELNVYSISAGEPLNPDDETSINYPENVIQLTGSRLVEGSITYSSNDDGTINLYDKIPQRWDGEYPAGEDIYIQIIESIKQKSIEPGEDADVERLIRKLNINF